VSRKITQLEVEGTRAPAGDANENNVRYVGQKYRAFNGDGERKVPQEKITIIKRAGGKVSIYEAVPPL